MAAMSILDLSLSFLRGAAARTPLSELVPRPSEDLSVTRVPRAATDPCVACGRHAWREPRRCPVPQRRTARRSRSNAWRLQPFLGIKVPQYKGCKKLGKQGEVSRARRPTRSSVAAKSAAMMSRSHRARAVRPAESPVEDLRATHDAWTRDLLDRLPHGSDSSDGDTRLRARATRRRSPTRDARREPPIGR